jgi:[NiFe] hydrogenase assembly HybE family chaperone
VLNRPFEGSYLGDGSRISDDARLECGICWWAYDPALGDEAAQIGPGTPFRLLPETWRCPNCDAEKSKFMVMGGTVEDQSPSDPVQTLTDAYRRASVKMKGLPIYNPALAIEAVGFREDSGRQVGVIVTPWFMNLTVLPSAEDLSRWETGGTARLCFPSGEYDFMVSEVEDQGLIASCSLFSPMEAFADHEAAQMTAKAAIDALFEPEEPEPGTRISRRQLLGG